jgi:hypothetical protein
LAKGCSECTECPNPSTTCNGEFAIEFLGSSKAGSYVTFEYKVCPGVNFDKGLSHWVLGMGQIDCYGEGYDINDLVSAIYLNGVEKEFTIVDPDPTTQLSGVKFDLTDNKEGCNTYAFVFNTDALADGYTLGEGCVLAATKAGNQDIRTAGPPANPNKSPGYACIIGPVCETEEQEVCGDETAWAANGDTALELRYTPQGNWATYVAYSTWEKTVYIFAGRTIYVGTATFSDPVDGMVTISINLTEATFYDDPDKPGSDNLMVQGYALAPSGNPAPGLFPYKKACSGTTCSIPVPENNFYGVHLVVVPNECETSNGE